MKIIIDKNAGFCFGVQNAVSKAYKLAEDKNEKIYTYGPLIHNEEVMKDLEENDVFVINSIEENDHSKDTIVIRAHGISEEEEENLRRKYKHVIDCTCPFVKAIHHIVKKAHEENNTILIVGDPSHPEVIGINGWCKNEGIVIEDEKILDKLSNYDKISIVAQTTITNELWKKVIEKVKNKFTNVEIHNTICSATRNRQESSVELARETDAVFVVGSQKSSNTNKLYELCKKNNECTFFVEVATDIEWDMLKGKSVIGITAGASTPDWIIKEVINKMEELQMNHADLYAQYEDTFKELEMGQIITGKVIQVTEDEIVVDVQYKMDGTIKRDDYTWDKTVNLKDLVKVDDQIEAEVYRISEIDGVYLSVKSIAARKNWTKLQDAFEKGTVLDGVVTSIVKGGGIVDVMGIRTFMPSSHFDLRFAEDLTPYLNQAVRVNIIDFVPEKKKIVVSRKEELKKVNAEKEAAVWAVIKVGDKVSGEVKRLTPFGAFVDLGGIDGLIYITELAWTRVKNPADILNVGQIVEVIVLSADPESKKISLSLKQLAVNPWDEVAGKYPKDSIVEAKVVRFADFGAFVQLEPGVDGLVHISQISEKRVNKVADELTIGQIVKAKVLEVNAENKKISLSIKAANIVPETVAEEAPVVEVETVQE